MIKQVSVYRTAGSTVILTHNGSSWYVALWGVFGDEDGFVNKRIKFGSDKHRAIEFYAARERELVIRDATMALIGPPTYRR